MLGEWALSMVGVEEGREFRFRGDLYSQESTLPLVNDWNCLRQKAVDATSIQQKTGRYYQDMDI